LRDLARRQLGHALTGDRHDRHRLDAEPLPQQVVVHPHAQPRRLVHHVERQHQGPAQLGQLQREREHAAQVLGIDHVHQHVRLAAQHDPLRHPLFFGRGQQGIQARSVQHSAATPSSRARPRVISTVVPGNWRPLRTCSSAG
jgi:hypothetical protein